MNNKNKISPGLLLTVLLLTVTYLGYAIIYYEPAIKDLFQYGTSQNTDVKIDEQAQKILKEMSNSLKDLQEFRFQSKGYFEVVDSMEKKEKMHNSGELYVKRPDKIKVSRTGEKSDIEFYCDGQQVALYGKGKNLYATANAESNLDKTFDYIRENLNIELPATDLLYSDVYEGLMQDVSSGIYLGKKKIGNTSCHHLSFTGKDVDWEIWVEDSEKKLPRKYVIKSKTIAGKPEAQIEIINWITDIKLNDNLFTFTPPKGAQKIEFLRTDMDTQTKR